MSEDFIAQYLAELRARLGTSPERAADIVAEAEDHLRQSMAASLASGMSEQDAQAAAISAFGSARTVARANRRPASALVPLGLAACKAAGVYLLTMSAGSCAVYFWWHAAVCDANLSIRCALLDHQDAGPPAVWAACGAAGLALLAGHHIARRVRRRSQVRVNSYPLGAAFAFIALAVILVVWHPRYVLQLGGQLPWALPGALIVAVGYLVQAVWQHRAKAA